MHTQAIPALKDNYIWSIIEPNKRQVIVIDPGDATPVLQFLQKENLTICAILLTHHHWDHCNGVQELKNHFTNIPVYGSKRENIPQVTNEVKENDIIQFDNFDFSFQILDIPAHTLGHVAFYGAQMVFTGDTLFSAGCGRLFEGTAEMMYNSLQKIIKLPDETRVYCGHEYTIANLKFAKTVEPNNSDIDLYLQKIIQLREKGLPSLPSLISDEKKINPFLRCDSTEIKKSVENYVGKPLQNPIEIFRLLREMKDKFV